MAGPANETENTNFWWTKVVYEVPLRDQRFARGVSENDVHRHMCLDNYVFQPLKREYFENSGIAEVIDNELEFRITLDVQQFRQTELFIRLINDELEVHGRHDLRDDGFGLVRRDFVRRYHVSHGVRPQNVISSLSEDGILTIQAYKESDDEVEVEINDLPEV